MVHDKITDRAIDFARRGDYTRALELFSLNKAYEGDGEALSYYALAVIRGLKKPKEAMAYCRKAVKMDKFNSVIYLNAGKVFLFGGKKDVAVKVLRRGLSVDPGNKEIINQLRIIGIRKKPFIGFLSRENIINKVAGVITATMHGGSGSVAHGARH